MKPLLIYCYDAYCGWCYGFSKVMRQLASDYADTVDIDVLSGGMIPAENPAHISKMAAYLAEAYKTVEDYAGVRFGDDWLWHVQNPDDSDWYPHSEKAAIALSIFKEYYPDKQVAFAADLQFGLYGEGRDLTDDEAYRHLIDQYGIQPEAFYTKLHSETYREKAHYEFALCKQLQVTGFPCLFVQASEQKLYMIARGFTPYDAVKERLDKVLAALPTSQ